MLISPEKLLDSRVFVQKRLDSLAYCGSLTTFRHNMLPRCSHCQKHLSVTRRQIILHCVRICFFSATNYSSSRTLEHGLFTILESAHHIPPERGNTVTVRGKAAWDADLGSNYYGNSEVTVR